MFVQIIVTLHVDLDSVIPSIPLLQFQSYRLSRQADAGSRDEGSVLVVFFSMFAGHRGEENLKSVKFEVSWPRHSMYGIFYI